MKINEILEYKEPNLDTIVERFDKVIDETISKYEEVLKIEKKTYNNFFIPLKKIDDPIFDLEITNLFHINSVDNNEENTNVVNEIQNLHISKLQSYLLKKVEILDATVFILENDITINEYEKETLKEGIEDKKRNGIFLNDKDKEKLNKINLKISELGNTFKRNVILSNQKFKMELTKEQLKGLTENDIKSMIVDGKYILTLDSNQVFTFLQYGEDRKIRKIIFNEYVNRAPENKEIYLEILELKDEKAKLLGFNNYAELSIDEKSAKSPKQVFDLLEEILDKSNEKFKSENKELKKWVKNNYNLKMKPYDTSFYSTKFKNEKYSIDIELQKKYFETTKMVDGFIKFAENLMDIKFKLVEKADKWDKDVLVYDLYDNNNIKISRVYYDFYSRETKSNGAWENGIISRDYNKEKDELTLPVVYVVTNFQKKNLDGNSFIEHNDVVTFFHEMGHAFYDLLTKIDYDFYSGNSGVKWDVVEFPSQFLEYFAYEKDIIQSFAKHFETNEVFPDSEIDKIIESKNYRNGSNTVRQIEFSMVDLSLHMNKIEKDNMKSILTPIYKKTSLKKKIKYKNNIRVLNTFQHIFSGGYSAGYYSYKWAEIFSADAYMEFSGLSVEDRKEKFKLFKTIVFESGGYGDMLEKLKTFTGREPSVDSLLKIDGII